MISAFKMQLAEKCYWGVLIQGNLPSAPPLSSCGFPKAHGHKRLFLTVWVDFVFRGQDSLLCLVKAAAGLTGTSPSPICQILTLCKSAQWLSPCSATWYLAINKNQVFKLKQNINSFGFYSESPKSHWQDYIWNSVSRNFTF